ncbi:MAG TPA: sigma 54-interacting transcriptional regulator [Thermoanaerobaculia bacterium]|nr:sigma 54-interacting transcriptional regulator [Thermoanaerobaculia bacterium]
MTVLYESEVTRIVVAAVSNVFASLGRYLLCLDENFRVIHADAAIRELLGGETLGPLEGRPVAELLGRELFGTDAPLREALLAGERREGWRALLQTNHGIRPLSITAAPLQRENACDPRVKYIVVILPAEEDHFAATSAPTVLSGLIARSPAMSRIFQLVENLQASEAPVLLTGERGTGKEVVARAIHEHSPRRRGPFVAVNCAALPPELLESELFGHVRGAFTGAVRDRIGRFELAAQGTLFLDEVSELPLETQGKLLRLLEQHLYTRLGETQTRSSEARIIAATNVDLRNTATFRQDLFYKLRIVPVEIPPLRARREDVEPLARLLLRRISERQGRHLRFSPEVIRHFLDYAWPGNVQELENAIEYAVAVTKGPVMQPEDLPAEICGIVRASGSTSVEKVSSDETQRLRAALETHRWRREETAKSLGISRATLWRRMREHGLL